MALGIDETFSADVDKKLQRIKNEIDRGALAKIPRVIIGADSQTVEELGELWIEKEKKTLGSHPIQFLIIKEMLLQLKTFEDYARKIGKPEIADVYARDREILEKIAKQKEAAEKPKIINYNDKVFQAIKNKALTIFQ